jgi:hypothetical protein
LTYGGLLHDIGYAGQAVDPNFNEWRNFINDQALAIQFGQAVARSAADNTCKAPTLDTDRIIGISGRHAIKASPGYGQTGANVVQYTQYDSVPIMGNGNIYAFAAENVTRGDAVVSLTASNGTLGSAANNPMPVATAAAQGNVVASGTITLTNNPVNGDSVTVNGVTVVFVTAAAVASQNQVLIAGTSALTAVNLQTFLATSQNPLLSVAQYTVATNVVTAKYLLGGTVGNSFTLSSSNLTVSAATLTTTQGYIEFNRNAVATNTVTINGQVITFVATAPAANQVLVGANAAATASNLATFLSTSGNALLVGPTYLATVNATGNVILQITNAVVTFTLAVSGTNDTNVTASGATLTGGTANTGNATIAMATQSTLPTALSGVYTIVCTAATTANVFDPQGHLLGTCSFGTLFSDEIQFTITAGGTPCVAGDSFEVTVNSATAGRPAVPTATWETTTTAGQLGIVRIRY